MESRDLKESDSSRNGKSEKRIDDFNLNDFYKSIKLNQLKRSSSSSTVDTVAVDDETSKNMLSYKRSRLLCKIGDYKGNYPSRMGIVEYLLHSYVILFCPNPVTLYSYEAVFKNLSPESDEFWKTLRTLTRVQLDVDKFPNDVPASVSLLLSSDEASDGESLDTERLDSHFTWLCKCCINVAEPKSDDEESSGEKRSFEDEEVKQSKKKSLGEGLTLNNVFGSNFDLSSDVLYEALRQRGNRFLQRSLHGNVKNLPNGSSRGLNPAVAAKLAEPSESVKRFMEAIQQSSIDSSEPNLTSCYELFGDERRHSTRRAILMPKRYTAT